LPSRDGKGLKRKRKSPSNAIQLRQSDSQSLVLLLRLSLWGRRCWAGIQVGVNMYMELVRMDGCLSNSYDL